MPRRRKSRKRSFFSVRTLFKFLKIGAFIAPAAAVATRQISNSEKVRIGLMQYTGFNMGTGKFNWGELAKGWLPYIATTLVTMGVQKLSGILRRL